MKDTAEKQQSLFDELRCADFPHEMSGQETLCKYTIRKWLIGSAILRGYGYEIADTLSGYIVRGPERVRVAIVSGGVQLGVGEKAELVETAY